MHFFLPEVAEAKNIYERTKMEQDKINYDHAIAEYYELTGGVAREITTINEIIRTKSFNRQVWKNQRIARFRGFLESWVKENQNNRKRFMEFLDDFFNPGYTGQTATPPSPNHFYDRGLIYFDTQQHRFRAISKLAQQPLQAYFFSAYAF